MPRIKEWPESLPGEWIASVGGSVLRQRTPKEGYEFKPGVVGQLTSFCRELLDMGVTPIIVVGGGPEARDEQRKARESGITDENALDGIGILVTQSNGMLVAEALAEGLPVQYIPAAEIINQGGSTSSRDQVIVTAGYKPGQTTDAVAVEIALTMEVGVVFNISDKEGIFRRDQYGNIIENKVVARMTWANYVNWFTKSHEPGIHVPFDPVATMLAIESDTTLIMRGGGEAMEIFEQLRKCIRGEEFKGTVIVPHKHQ